MTTIGKKLEVKQTHKLTKIQQNSVPWHNAGQFSNDYPNYTFIRRYLDELYKIATNAIKEEMKPIASIPSLINWNKNIRSTTKVQLKTNFVKEACRIYKNENKKYRNGYWLDKMNNIKEKFNRDFKLTPNEEVVLIKELGPRLKNALDSKMYWLQINGDVLKQTNLQFYSKWYPKIEYTPITRIYKKDESKDLVYNIECEDKRILYTLKTRWGGRQLMFNFRTDLSGDTPKIKKKVVKKSFNDLISPPLSSV